MSAGAVVPPLVRRRVAKLEERAGRDAVCRAGVLPWLALDISAWAEDGEGAVEAYVGERWCRVRSEECEIGHAAWTGSKRIPL